LSRIKPVDAVDAWVPRFDTAANAAATVEFVASRASTDSRLCLPPRRRGGCSRRQVRGERRGVSGWRSSWTSARPPHAEHAGRRSGRRRAQRRSAL